MLNENWHTSIGIYYSICPAVPNAQLYRLVQILWYRFLIVVCVSNSWEYWLFLMGNKSVNKLCYQIAIIIIIIDWLIDALSHAQILHVGNGMVHSKIKDFSFLAMCLLQTLVWSTTFKRVEKISNSYYHTFQGEPR